MRHPIQKQELTAVVLAGGRGRRLGGTDKGLLEVAGRPLIARVLAALAPQVGQILINANRHQAEYAAYGYPVISDAQADYPGPLAGIASGLAQAQTDYVLCVPCDAAWLPPDLAERLAAALYDSGGSVAAVHDGIWLHPVCCLVSRALLPDLQQWLAQGRREVAGWLQYHGLVTVSFSHWPAAYWSLNTQADLAGVEWRLRNSRSRPPELILEGAA